MEPVGSASVAGVTSPHLVCAPEAALLLHLLDPGRVHAPLHLPPCPGALRGAVVLMKITALKLMGWPVNAWKAVVSALSIRWPCFYEAFPLCLQNFVLLSLSPFFFVFGN